MLCIFVCDSNDVHRDLNSVDSRSRQMCIRDRSPIPQHDGECSDCPLARWESADNGKGKACKNARRLAVLAYDESTELGEAQMAMLKAPPTSLKNWASYAKSIALRYNRPTSTVVTAGSFNADNDYHHT